MDSLSTVSLVLHELSNTPVSNELHDQRISFERGDALLAEHATAIFGPVREELKTRIMVTMPSEAAEDPELIYELLAHGMNIMRVNCAHDGRDAWARMIQHLRYAEKHVQANLEPCDLGGPKLRTGKIALGPEVIKWRPYRNTLGQVTAHAIVHFAKPGLEGELQADGDSQSAASPMVHPSGILLSSSTRAGAIEICEWSRSPKPGVCVHAIGRVTSRPVRNCGCIAVEWMSRRIRWSVRTD